jgi:hypothetical protein
MQESNLGEEISERFNTFLKSLVRINIFNSKGKMNPMRLSPDFDFSNIIEGLSTKAIDKKM